MIQIHLTVLGSALTKYVEKNLQTTAALPDQARLVESWKALKAYVEQAEKTAARYETIRRHFLCQPYVTPREEDKLESFDSYIDTFEPILNRGDQT